MGILLGIISDPHFAWKDSFNDDFWLSLDGICNALDNMEAHTGQNWGRTANVRKVGESNIYSWQSKICSTKLRDSIIVLKKSLETVPIGSMGRLYICLRI